MSRIALSLTTGGLPSTTVSTAHRSVKEQTPILPATICLRHLAIGRGAHGVEGTRSTGGSEDCAWARA